MGLILSTQDLTRAQAFCQVLLLKAVNDEHGRDELDPFYKIVTEGRDVGKWRPSYSSCADLAHWQLRCLGVRAPWLNRDDDGDEQKWRTQVNLNWLCPQPIGKCPIARPKLQGPPEPGDIFVENNAHGGHVFCAVSYDAAKDTLTTAEYGQPGGKRKKREGFSAAFAKRPLSHIRLRDVLEICSAAVDVSPIADWVDEPGRALDEFAGLIPWPEPAEV
jgi:hypothetical protein